MPNARLFVKVSFPATRTRLKQIRDDEHIELTAGHMTDAAELGDSGAQI